MLSYMCIIASPVGTIIVDKDGMFVVSKQLISAAVCAASGCLTLLPFPKVGNVVTEMLIHC